jgi:hypothetical protein
MADNVTSMSEAMRGAKPAPDLFEDGDGGDGGERRFTLPPDSPIKPLGKQGLTLHLLDHLNQLHALKVRELGKGELRALCHGDEWLKRQWPQMSKEDWSQFNKHKEAGGTRQPWEFASKFDQDKAQGAIIDACSDQGVFSPQGNVFGRGAHRRASDDALVLHIGRRVLIVGGETVRGKRGTVMQTCEAGVVDRKIYPQLPPLPPPAEQSSTRDEALRLIELFGKWYFADGAIAHILLLGWDGLAQLCGAFSWRPHVLLTGETSAGKSTLQKILRATLDEWGLFSSEASEAAVRQMLGDDTLPVLLDEAEGDDKAERARAMINLARKASSGDKIHRGSSDHQAREFTAQSTFLLSCILHAPLDPQDRNRFVILPMSQVPEDADEPILDLRYWREAGRRFQRRMIEQWPRFDKTLGEYKNAIKALGFQGRWRDTFGTLLACADMLLYEEAPSDAGLHSKEGEGPERLTLWTKMCLPLLERSALEAESTTERCLRYLTSQLLPAMTGHHQETVGQWIMRAVQFDAAGDFDKAARGKLKTHGLRLVNLTKGKDGAPGCVEARMGEPIYLLVACGQNVGIQELFRNSAKWTGGRWAQALGDVVYEKPGVGRFAAVKGIKARFTGDTENAVAVPVEAFIGTVWSGD